VFLAFYLAQVQGRAFYTFFSVHLQRRSILCHFYTQTVSAEAVDQLLWLNDVAGVNGQRRRLELVFL
jgi:hypothetical protein